MNQPIPSVWFRAGLFAAILSHAIVAAAENPANHRAVDEMIPTFATQVRFPHDEGVFAVAVSPDGKLVATGDADSKIHLWDLTRGDKIKTLEGHEGNIVDLDIDRHGWKLATAGFDGVRIWHLPDGTAENFLPTQPGAILWIRFSPDGKTLAAGGLTSLPIQFWDFASGQALSSLPESSGGSRCASFSPDGRRLSVSSSRTSNIAEVCVWDVHRRQELVRFAAHAGDIRKMEFTADGKNIITASNTGEVVVWNAASAGPFSQRFPDMDGDIMAMALSRDGAMMATASRNDRTIHLWEVATGAELGRFTGHRNVIKSIAFSIDGRTAVSGSFDPVAIAWKTSANQAISNSRRTPSTPDEARLQREFLAGDDAMAAQNTMSALAEKPGLAIPLAKSWITLVDESQQQRIVESIANLRHRDFSTRRQAIQRLTAIGDMAEPALRRVYVGPLSLTDRQRLDGLLTVIQRQPVSPQKRTNLRCLQLLERIGNDEAKRVLTHIAHGWNDDLCTAVAAGAVQRLSMMVTSDPSDSPMTKDFNHPAPGPANQSELLPAKPFVGDETARAIAEQIDQLIESNWPSDVVAAPPADDAEWLRRVSLDLAGRIPLACEVEDFVAEPSLDKKYRYVEQLLASPEAIDHQVDTWRTILIGNPKRDGVVRRSFNMVSSMENWLSDTLRKNQSYRDMMHQIITVPLPDENGAGKSQQAIELSSTPLAYYFRQDDVAPAVLAGDCARIFLGVRLDCAECHDHPFSAWKQQQFWEFAAFFSGVRSSPRSGGQFLELQGEDRERDSLKIPNTNKLVTIHFLDGREPVRSSGRSPRELLGDWMTSPENPYFARAGVNRVWAEFFGVGLVEPIDDIQESSSSRLDILNMLAEQFRANNYNLRLLRRAIVLSRAYQRTSRTTHESQRQPDQYAKMPVRSLTSAQLDNSLLRASGRNQRLVPISEERRRHQSRLLNPIEVGRQANLNGPRSQTETTLADALFYMNDVYLNDLAQPQSGETLDQIIHDQQSDRSEKIESLYLATMSRRPGSEEVARITNYLDSRAADERAAFSEIFWALINSNEFMSNH